jgi:hypothetical protein
MSHPDEAFGDFGTMRDRLRISTVYHDVAWQPAFDTLWDCTAIMTLVLARDNFGGTRRARFVMAKQDV